MPFVCCMLRARVLLEGLLSLSLNLLQLLRFGMDWKNKETLKEKETSLTSVIFKSFNVEMLFNDSERFLP